MYPDSRYITIHGLTLHFRVIMPASPVRHRVLLVASPGQSTYNWRLLIPELTGAGCQCVLCDLPGFGLSDCRDDAPQDHPTRAQFLWGLLDTLDMEDNGQLNCWHLMAHGSACGTIAAMAALQPDSTGSLMMLCPILYPVLPPFLKKLADRPATTRLIRALLRRYVVPQQRFAKTASHLYGAPVPEKALPRLHQTALSLVGHEEVLRRLLVDGYDADLSHLNDLFAPAMIIWGKRDPILGGEIPARLRSRDFKTAEYHVLASAGHCPAETHSQAVCDFLRGWIRELWAGGSD